MSRSAASEARVTRMTCRAGGGQPGGGEFLEEDRVEGFTVNRSDAVKEVGEEETGNGDRKGDAHVDHGAAAGLHARLAEDREAVAHGFDAGVGAGAHAVGFQEQGEEAEPTELRRDGVDLVDSGGGDVAEARGVAGERVDQGVAKAWVPTKTKRAGAQSITGFADAAEIQEV